MKKRKHKKFILPDIEEKLRSYNIVLLEAEYEGGIDTGKSILIECIALSKEYVSSGGNKKDLVELVDVLIANYNALIASHKITKEHPNTIKALELLNVYKNEISKLSQ